METMTCSRPADEQRRRPERVITDSNKRTRAEHWEQNADQARAAAVRYLEAQHTDQPVSLDDVAREFQTSARSVSRYVRLIKAEK